MDTGEGPTIQILSGGVDLASEIGDHEGEELNAQWPFPMLTKHRKSQIDLALRPRVKSVSAHWIWRQRATKVVTRPKYLFHHGFAARRPSTIYTQAETESIGGAKQPCVSKNGFTGSGRTIALTSSFTTLE